MRAQEIIDTTPLTEEDLRVLDRMDGELAPLARELLTDIERNGGMTAVEGSV
jgi:hypothetical protein